MAANGLLPSLSTKFMITTKYYYYNYHCSQPPCPIFLLVVLFFFPRREIDREKSTVFHLKFWYMAFSNLGSHNVLVLGPSWHWVALTEFCASKSLLFLRISWSCDSLPSTLIFILSICQVYGITFLAFCLVPNHSYFGGRVLGQKAAWFFWLHSMSKDTLLPLLASHKLFPSSYLLQQISP